MSRMGRTPRRSKQTIETDKAAQVALEQATAVEHICMRSRRRQPPSHRSSKPPAEDALGTFGKLYQGMFPEGGNMVDFMEVILSGFVRLESETKAAEAEVLAQFKDRLLYIVAGILDGKNKLSRELY